MAAVCGVLALVVPASAGTSQIKGDYVESRTADVYTGPCFSNAEAFITGNQAVMAWKVTEGSWNGVDLSGLSVAAAVIGSTTFSEDNPSEARSILIVDHKASPAQREALVAMAKTLGGDRLKHVASVKSSMMIVTVESHEMAAQEQAAEPTKPVLHVMPHAPRASFWAPGIAEILTRPLDEGDHACGNEVVAYEPLSKGVEVLPAYTLGHTFKGEGLNSRWSTPNNRGSFVGHFAY
ncbi:MAG TPA: DUF1326 domain-containing protein [Isosphaeraceae bacterium]|nr:DUF1326 domain-containing protein [Isosphaeraceae bacterium]